MLNFSFNFWTKQQEMHPPYKKQLVISLTIYFYFWGLSTYYIIKEIKDNFAPFFLHRQ